jgi:hypothetical protein
LVINGRLVKTVDVVGGYVWLERHNSAPSPPFGQGGQRRLQLFAEVVYEIGTTNHAKDQNDPREHNEHEQSNFGADGKTVSVHYSLLN